MSELHPSPLDFPPDDPRRLSLSSKLDRLLDALLGHPSGDVLSILLSINERLDRMSDQLDALGDALAQNLSMQQDLLNDFASHLATAHPQAANDPRVQGFISQLQAATNNLSNAHTQFVNAQVGPSTGGVSGTIADGGTAVTSGVVGGTIGNGGTITSGGTAGA